MPHKHKKLGIAALKNTKFNKKTISYRKSLKNTPNCISSKLILHTHEFCGLNRAKKESEPPSMNSEILSGASGGSL